MHEWNHTAVNSNETRPDKKEFKGFLRVQTHSSFDCQLYCTLLESCALALSLRWLQFCDCMGTDDKSFGNLCMLKKKM